MGLGGKASHGFGKASKRFRGQRLPGIKKGFVRVLRVCGSGLGAIRAGLLEILEVHACDHAPQSFMKDACKQA